MLEDLIKNNQKRVTVEVSAKFDESSILIKQ